MDAATAEKLSQHVAAEAFAEADALCAELVAQQPENAGLWHMRGGIALTAKDWTAAEAHFRTARLLAPDAAKPWLGCARALVGQGRSAPAAEAAARALALGLDADDAAAADWIVAEALFHAGRRLEGIARLAATAPYYAQRCAAGDREAVLRAFSGIVAGMCAGDVTLVEALHGLLYPHAATVGPMAIARTATLAEWCARHGAFRIVDPPRRVERAATAPAGRAFAYETTPIRAAVVPGGRYIPGFDFVLAPDGTVLRDSGYMALDATFNFRPHTFYPPADLVAHHSPAKVVDIDAEALFLSAPPDGNIGHWIIDFLPRLQGRDAMKVAMPAPLRAKQRDTLALCGVRDTDIIACAPDAQYRFRALHVYAPGRSMPPHPWNAAFLRRCFWGERAAQPTPGKRVFLARTSVGTRMIANAEAFAATLKDEGFVSADMADLSIAQQRALLGDAEVLLGGMGTNLLALYFAPPGCRVIGIIDDPALDPLIAQTCAMVGLSCEYLVSQPAGASSHALHSRDLDFVVDCEELRRRLRRDHPDEHGDG